MSRYSQVPPKERLPEWIRTPIGNATELESVQAVVKQQRLHTICEEGRCPNRGECYASGTATFLLGGSICTRSCAFCQVDKGLAPEPMDDQKPSASPRPSPPWVCATSCSPRSPGTIKATTGPPSSPGPWPPSGHGIH